MADTKKTIKNFLKERRKKVADKLKNFELIIAFANSESDNFFPFIQDKNFYYFTGLSIPEAVLVIGKFNNKAVSHLFIERNIPERVVWEGKKMSKEEASEISGIDSVFYIDEFEQTLFNLLKMSNIVFISNKSKNFCDFNNKEFYYSKKIRKFFPDIMFVNILSIVTELRLKKDNLELENLKYAINLTGEGIRLAYKNVKPGMKEYEIEALFYHNMLRQGVRNWGFKPIIASGINAATLHYELNNTTIEKETLLLMDVGVLYNNYSADITRTVPVSGKFTKRQKDVYQSVLSVQKKIISMIRPGISLGELNHKTIELTTKELHRLNLIEKDEDYVKYYMHSVSHFLGMDAHDVGGRNRVLEEGNVITVEPGIYIPEENMGVRIEDDILVTNDGFFNLSENIPKEVEDIENFKKG